MNWIVPRSAAAALCGALVSTSCAANSPSAARQIESAVGIVATGCSLVAQLGSGVVLESAGRIVTVAHTIAGASEIAVVDSDGTEHIARVMAFDKDSDLAVLDAPTIGVEPLMLGAITVGPAYLFVWSRNGGTEAKPVEVLKRLRITIEDIYIDEIVQRTGLEIEGDVEIGDSGGAIVSDRGKVMGIVYANSRERGSVGFATDVAEIRDVLSSAAADPVPNGRCS